MKQFITFLLVVFLFFSCNNEPVNRTYYNDELGWNFEAPVSWKYDSEDKIAQDIADGQKMMKEAGKEFKVADGSKSLFTLRKNQLTKLQASIIPFEEKYEGHWLHSFLTMKGQIYNGFVALGFEVDSSSNTEIIDSIKFEVLNMTIHERASGVKMYQEMYRAHINDYDFVVNINYDKNRYKNQIKEAWLKSTFDKK